MFNSLRIFTLGMLILATAPVTAGDLRPFSITFDASDDTYSLGDVHIALTQSDAKWSMRSVTTPSGMLRLLGHGEIRESSVMRVSAAHDQRAPVVRTQRYSIEQDGGEPDRNVSASFKQGAKELTATDGTGNSTTLVRDSIIHSPLSVMLQTMLWLRHQSIQTKSVPLLSRQRLKQTTLTVLGRENVKIGETNYNTIRVARSQSGGSRETHTWYAVDWEFAPVKMEQFKRGKLKLRLLANSIEID
ncbi:MAG: DUF3108 domain-containing protein [Pseudomonadota bacterium]